MANPAAESLEMHRGAQQPDSPESGEDSLHEEVEPSIRSLRPSEHEDRRVRLSGKRASTLVGQAILQLPIWGMYARKPLHLHLDDTALPL